MVRDGKNVGEDVEGGAKSVKKSKKDLQATLANLLKKTKKKSAENEKKHAGPASSDKKSEKLEEAVGDQWQKVAKGHIEAVAETEEEKTARVTKFTEQTQGLLSGGVDMSKIDT